MPFINVKTNQTVEKAQADRIKAALGKAITAVPGKSETWLMVNVEGGQMLYFQGSDAPAAIAQTALFGNASGSALNTLTQRITEILNTELGIPNDRVYVSYQLTEHWGWNGGNF
ncbi:MAG: hypothetical protein IK130_01305 [Oscillospiraceae bacterium]|nr:hypothetical protein [Oscillospiraceae bacterium]